MPLVIVCGLPCSGKTTYSQQLRDYLLEKGCKHVKIVNEEGEQILKAAGYADSLSEKSTRGLLKSAVDHALGADCVVIVDSLNYIKGFRYELHCIARTLRMPQCTVWVQADVAAARPWNSARLEVAGDGFPEAIFEELCRRFEAPLEKNRWDTPLFLVDMSPPRAGAGGEVEGAGSGAGAADPLQAEQTVFTCSSSSWRRPASSSSFVAASSSASSGASSFKRPAAQGGGGLTFSGSVSAGPSGRGLAPEASFPRILDQLLSVPTLQPNSSTTAAPHGSADQLTELHRVAQQIHLAITAHQTDAAGSLRPIIFGQYDRTLELHRFVSVSELQRHARQFVSLHSKRPPEAQTAQQIGATFIDFLASQL